jgi:hypothetical protein
MSYKTATKTIKKKYEIYQPLSQHRGYNDDSGLVYRNCGKGQYGKKPIFFKLGLNPIKYENKANVNAILTYSNSKKGDLPNFYSGKDREIKQQKDQVYYDVPKVEIGGKKQTKYDGPE